MRLIRCSQRALLTALVVIWLPSQAATASQYDGSYVGTIECDQIPGHTRGPIKVAFFLKIGGGQVEYERWHVRPAAAGQVTGFVDMATDLAAKRVQLLKELVPGLTRIAVLWNVGSPLKAHDYRETEAGARALGLQLQSLAVRDPYDFETKFKEAAKEHAGAVVVLPDPLTTGHARRIARLAAEGRLPTIFGLRDGVDAGGLLAYGHSRPAYYRRAAAYVDKILKGARPGDLPIQQGTTFELVINAKTAKALGLTIPQTLLQRADHVIQ